MLDNQIKEIIINEFMKNNLYIFINDENLNNLCHDLKKNLKEKINNDEIVINEIIEISKQLKKVL